MMGSLTFIIVALRWRLKRTPLSLASSISAAKNSRSFATSMRDASMTSPAWRGVRFLSVWASPPPAGTNSIATTPASLWSPRSAGTTWDCSLPKKSPSAMWATWLFESGAHAPILCGFARA